MVVKTRYIKRGKKETFKNKVQNLMVMREIYKILVIGRETHYISLNWCQVAGRIRTRDHDITE